MAQSNRPLMSRCDIEATRRPFGEARPLSGAPYHDERIFAAELDTIFFKTWVCAGHQSVVAEPGSYVQRELGGESVLITRAVDGRLHAFYNVCRHRGTRLVEAEEGNDIDCIRCPYHGWTYGLDGALQAAPLMSEVQGFDKSVHQLTPLRLETWEGFLFISFDEAAPPLGRYLGDVPDLSRYAMSDMRCGGTHSYDIAANWKLICENYGECYHCPSNHPQLNPISNYRSGGDSFEGEAFCGGPMLLNDGCRTMTMDGQTDRKPVAGLPEEDLKRVHYFNIYPALLLSVHPDYVLTHTLWPLAADRTRIRCEWLFPPEAADAGDFDPSDAIDFWHMTNEQDWAICERAQKGVRSRGYVPGRYHGLEETIYFFDNWYLRMMESVLTRSEGDGA